MSETGFDERRDMEQRLADGRGITVDEARRLIQDADSGERAEAAFGGLKKALREQLGIAVLDVSTDDDDGEVRMELVEVKEGERQESAIR